MVLDQRLNWPVRASKSSEYRHQEHHAELWIREVKRKRYLRENHLLEHHRDRNCSADHNAAYAGGHHQYESFHEVNESDPVGVEAHRPQDADLFRLVKKIGTHTRA